jgi:hypothetical protein
MLFFSVLYFQYFPQKGMVRPLRAARFSCTLTKDTFRKPFAFLEGNLWTAMLPTARDLALLLFPLYSKRWRTDAAIAFVAVRQFELSMQHLQKPAPVLSSLLTILLGVCSFAMYRSVVASCKNGKIVFW